MTREMIMINSEITANAMVFVYNQVKYWKVKKYIKHPYAILVGFGCIFASRLPAASVSDCDVP